MVGYARTSTHDQIAGLEAQIRDLKSVGCTKLYEEQVSSVDVAQRDRLREALAYVREGDTLVVTKLDRLVRSMSHLMDIVDDLDAKKVSLRILAMGIDTSTSTGRLMLTVLGGVAEFERAIMLERQKEGISKAKAAGKYKGRAPTAQRRTSEVKALITEGIGPTEIAKRLSISRASVYNILKTSSA